MTTDSIHKANNMTTSNPADLLREALAQLFECVGVRPGLIRHVAANVEQALALIEADPWIRVAERLPPLGKYVLTVHSGIVQSQTWAWDGEVWFCAEEDADPAELDEFTHWMPLPKGPVSR